MTPASRSAVVAHALDAQSANARQHRALYAPSGDVDSALEHLAVASRMAVNDRQRDHIRDAMRLILSALRDNQGERNCERQIAAIAQNPDAARPWSLRRVVRETRDPLATLLNPIIVGKPREQALATVMAVIRDAPPELIGSHAKPNVTLAHELAPAKTTRLWDLVAEAQAAAT